ncbi:MAG: hypothetical protein HYW06_11965 [Gemmatimonadetes bacterium]|nr:hypothetical protein [Gemmatimonadota bacterium]
MPATAGEERQNQTRHQQGPAAMHGYLLASSTRRFCGRPSGVSFEATGFDSLLPWSMAAIAFKTGGDSGRSRSRPVGARHKLSWAGSGHYDTRPASRRVGFEICPVATI